ncbi:MAG: hypothetical protein R3D34_02260 [Nitratireductor sp.]
MAAICGSPSPIASISPATARLPRAPAFAARFAIAPIITNDVLYHRPSRRVLQDVVTSNPRACNTGRSGHPTSGQCRAPSEGRPGNGASVQFSGSGNWLHEGEHLFSTLQFSLDELRYQYPDETPSSGLSQQQELARLAFEGAAQRYPQGFLSESLRRYITVQLIGNCNTPPIF